MALNSKEYQDALKAIYDAADYRDCSDAHQNVATCFDNINQYEVGKLSGQFFASYYSNFLRPNTS